MSTASSPETTELAPTYQPADVEPGVAARWEAADAFHAVPVAPDSRHGNAEAAAEGDASRHPLNGAAMVEGTRRPYSIVIPPPNVTAALHMGHALNNTLQDILIRHHRMCGDNAMWMPGTDHAGIATQTVVEKRVLQEEGKRRTDFDRDEFVEKIQAWKDVYERRITDQLKAMGCSCDWERQRFTMDEVCAAAVREAFFQLFREGLIYRGKRLVNWDPVTQTALADDEVEMEEVDGSFWYLKYPVVEEAHGFQSVGYVTVATTRPETMLGDTAVAVNPADPRAADLRGKFVKLPIVNRVVPIIEDDYVMLPDPESTDQRAQFASGFLKVTPAHDPNDYDIGRRHDLVIINVMAPDASISLDYGWPESDAADADPFLKEDLVGLSREDARRIIVKWFKAHDLLEEVRPYRHAVGHSYRSHVPVEPYLSDQWYVAVKRPTDRLGGRSLAQAALDALAEDQRGGHGGPGHGGTGVSPVSSGEPEEPESPVSPMVARASRASMVGRASRPSRREGVDQTLRVYERHLPHWQLGGSTYFTTFRVKKSDNLSPEERRTVLDACLHWDHQRADVHLVVVMPDHVHMLLTPRKQADGQWHSLEKLLHSIKSYMAHHIQKRRGAGGSLWEDESFDLIVRDEEEFAEKWNYMRMNAVKAGLADRPEEYPFLAGGDSPVPGEDGPEARPTMQSTEAWEGNLRFTPARYARTYQQRLEEAPDWCISRQLWWGHRIPVWTGDALAMKENQYSVDTWDVMPITLEWLSPEERKQVVAWPRMNTARGMLEAQVCVRPGHREIETKLENEGFTRDPDVLDTWFSSALWPLSTLGWPDPSRFPDQFPDGDAALRTWNPTSVLCTAREIITLWVSRMAMFNLYFTAERGQGAKGPRGQGKEREEDEKPHSAPGPLGPSAPSLPFRDVFIHAMIQDGHGQKMSKSLGNGVDPMDIIHSHGSDAMRFTLASMTTHTQDVRMPVEMVDPHSGEPFTPKYVTGPGGVKVAAPIQASPRDASKKMVSSYGQASGEATPTGPEGDLPLARNTSEKFDLGRNFANKLWNAVRFALSNLTEPQRAASVSERSDSDRANSRDDSSTDRATANPEEALPHGRGSFGLVDTWILSRLARTIRATNQALGEYRFADYAQTLYDFFWRDLCDWYLEAIKPTVGDDSGQQRVLATCLDGSLRLLHPIMPFITERLWSALNGAAPERGVPGIEVPPSELLVNAPWPQVTGDLVDEEAEATFELLQNVVGGIRQVRTQHQTPPRQTVELSSKLPAELANKILKHRSIPETLANYTGRELGPNVQRPKNAAVAVVGDIEIYVHDLVDVEKERQRLEKRTGEIEKQIKTLRGRLSNENYVNKAPAHLVQETRDQLAAAEREAEVVHQQIEALD